MSVLLEKIRSRGYWQVVIRPTRFIEKRVPDIAMLYPILQKSYVSLRGWNFPHLDTRSAPHIDIDWIGQEFEWAHHLSEWRFYQSGQFIHISSMPIDWRDQSPIWPADENWRPGDLLGVGDTIFSFTEAFEFAARLALSDAGGEEMHIAITVGNLKGRTLYVDSRRRWSFHSVYKTSIEKFPYLTELPKSDLVAKPRDIGLEAAGEMFKRFGWKTTADLLRDWQDEVMR